MSYDYWKAALAGQKPEANPDNPQCGFYRTKRGTGWVPIAVWPKKNGLEGPESLGFKIGTEAVGANMGTELWSHYCAHPISEAVYRAVAERSENWPDADPVVATILAERQDGDLPAPTADPVTEFAQEADTALGGVDTYARIESDEADVRALSLRNLLNQLAADADKARVEEKEPHLKASREVDAKWQPLVKRLREGAGKVKTARDDWEQAKRDAAKAAAKATQEAIAATPPGAPPPAALPSNLPPPATQVKPNYGRASSAGSKMVVTEIDYDKFFAALKLRPEWPTVQAQFDEWAQKLANKGIIPEGVKAEERANTR